MCLSQVPFDLWLSMLEYFEGQDLLVAGQLNKTTHTLLRQDKRFWRDCCLHFGYSKTTMDAIIYNGDTDISEEEEEEEQQHQKQDGEEAEFWRHHCKHMLRWRYSKLRKTNNQDLHSQETFVDLKNGVMVCPSKMEEHGVCVPVHDIFTASSFSSSSSSSSSSSVAAVKTLNKHKNKAAINQVVCLPTGSRVTGYTKNHLFVSSNQNENRFSVYRFWPAHNPEARLLPQRLCTVMDRFVTGSTDVNGSLLAYCDEVCRLKIFDMHRNLPILDLQLHTDVVSTTLFTDQIAVILADEPGCRVFDLNGSPTAILKTPSRILSSGVDHLNRTMTLSYKGGLSSFDFTSGQLAWRMPFKTPVTAVSFEPQWNLMLTGSSDGMIGFWDMRYRKTPFRSLRVDGGVTAIQTSLDLNLIAVKCLKQFKDIKFDFERWQLFEVR